jgi:uncharacterized protein (DUF433 family)
MIFAMMNDRPIGSGNRDVMGGTRVPVQTLQNYVEAGESIEDFLEGLPPVTREHIIAFPEEAKDRVV